MRVIAGTAGGVRLLTPDGMLTRPTIERVKEAIFSSVQFELPGMQVLDLFAGTGQMGIEALSRGAKWADFVDHRREAIDLVRENLARTKLGDRASLHCKDYETFLRSAGKQYDLILLDPPYAEKFLENALKIISEIDILAKDGIIITERPADKPLDGEIPGLIRKKDRRYGTVMITTFRKSPEA